MSIVRFVLVVQVESGGGLDYKTYVTESPSLVLELGPHQWPTVVTLLSVCILLLSHRFFGRRLLGLTCAPAFVLEDHKCRVCTIEMRRVKQRTVRKETYKWKRACKSPELSGI